MSNAVVYPRLRMSTNSSMALTTSWQKVNFSAPMTGLNVNTFGAMADGVREVSWDGTNQMLKFAEKDINYTGFLFFSTTVSAITTRTTIQYRFVIPNGTSPGVPLYFPFPDQGGYADSDEITVISGAQKNNKPEPIPLYITDALKTNSCYLEVKLGNPAIAIGTFTLNNCAILIQGDKP